MNSAALHQILGPAMAPLWLCSFILVALAFNRWRALRQNRVMDADMVRRVQDRIARLDLAEAEAEAAKSTSVIGQAWAKGLREFRLGGLSLQDALANATASALKPLKKNLNNISTIGVIAPMIGLIGTVVGMIMTFAALAETGTTNKTELAAGLSFALYKTAGGLIVAIPAIILGRYFQGKIAAYATQAEADILSVHYAYMHGKASARELTSESDQETESLYPVSN